MGNYSLRIGIIIPAFNEEHRLENLFANLALFHQVQHLYHFHFLIVNDGSTDKSAEMIQAESNRHSYLSCIDRSENKGKGYSILEGMGELKGKYDYIGFMDADLATPLYHLDKMASHIKGGEIDFLIGQRVSKQYESGRLWRNVASRAFSFLTRIPLKDSYKDTQAGFKFYKNELAQMISELSCEEGFAFMLSTYY